MSTLRGDGLAPSPHEAFGSFLGDGARQAVTPEIEKLFADALAGNIPRSRELKAWEPQTLSERHLAIIMMRSAGFKQRQIAQAIGATDSNVSVVLNHPDAEYILARLAAARFAVPSSIEKRLEALNEQAMDSLEEFFDPAAEVPVVKRAPLAFKLLESNGHGRKKIAHTHEHKHRFEAAPEQLAQLTKAIKESRQIQAPQTMEVGDLRTGEVLLSLPAGQSGSPGDSGVTPAPQGVGAPSVDGSQETTPPKDDTDA